MEVYHYSPDDVGLTIAGMNISGFPESGAFIEIQRESPLFTHQRSMDGEVAVVTKRYSTYTVTITLAQTSPSNGLLHQIQKLQQKSSQKNNSTSVFGLSRLNSLYKQASKIITKLPLIIKDSGGKAMFFSTSLWIENEPKVAYTDNVDTRVWTIKCFEATHIIAGSEDYNNLTEALAAINFISDLPDALRGLL